MNPTFQNIIREREWDKPNALQSSNLDLPQIMENIEERLSHRLPPGVPFTLTRFQEKVIGDEQFWRNWKSEDVSHLVVQGATSAGKTLVSELAILDTLNHGQKAVVLVPLKAMVHERMVQLRKDMPNQDIFGSSSDHLEYDERLMNEGKYDVAVTVYEKFFAMLNQNASNLMKDCALLVVDELSMLSKEQRGPKLEMLLEETDAQDARRNVLWCDGRSDARQEGNELWSLVHTRNLGGEIPKLQVNCTPFVRQVWYNTCTKKRGVFLCQKEYQTSDTRQSLSNL